MRVAIWIVVLVAKRGLRLKFAREEVGGFGVAHRVVRGTTEPLFAQTPSTHAPLRPRMQITNDSLSSSYSMRAWSRETLFSGPRSMSTCTGTASTAPELLGIERRPIVHDSVLT